MGGRLDSTNIVVPDMAVITPIELEHTQYLGDTIAKIAGEKAGIIKNEKPVCISPQKPEALEVLSGRPHKENAHCSTRQISSILGSATLTQVAQIVFWFPKTIVLLKSKSYYSTRIKST